MAMASKSPWVSWLAPDVEEVASGAASTITDEGMIELQGSLKTFYNSNAQFLLNRRSLTDVRKLKDGQGRFIWMPGLASGQPNLILGDPYTEMPDMDDPEADSYPVAYGNFKRAYTWVDRLQMEVLRDIYTQAPAGKVRTLARKRVGGGVTLAEAFKKLKCSAG